MTNNKIKLKTDSGIFYCGWTRKARNVHLLKKWQSVIKLNVSCFKSNRIEFLKLYLLNIRQEKTMLSFFNHDTQKECSKYCGGPAGKRGVVLFNCQFLIPNKKELVKVHAGCSQSKNLVGFKWPPCLKIAGGLKTALNLVVLSQAPSKTLLEFCPIPPDRTAL